MVVELIIQIRDVVHEAEDVIDTYVAVKIDEINAKIKQIFDNNERYDIKVGKRSNKEEAEQIWKQRGRCRRKMWYGLRLTPRLFATFIAINCGLGGCCREARVGGQRLVVNDCHCRWVILVVGRCYEVWSSLFLCCRGERKLPESILHSSREAVESSYCGGKL
ncbi:hypothetical protein LR48_Vigan01g130100 [Vigna angularis]|uniref:Rx N-terminal domain-containing protein n=1 Tax=Phaseolus angularis TaxID=3914 RepID=A0A0L9TMQ9_PHAAN|nr:hypothetical protein LR48_Vigan01g130100 [Vigna angularis]